MLVSGRELHRNKWSTWIIETTLIHLWFKYPNFSDVPSEYTTSVLISPVTGQLLLNLCPRSLESRNLGTFWLSWSSFFQENVMGKMRGGQYWGPEKGLSTLPRFSNLLMFTVYFASSSYRCYRTFRMSKLARWANYPVAEQHSRANKKWHQ